MRDHRQLHKFSIYLSLIINFNISWREEKGDAMPVGHHRPHTVNRTQLLTRTDVHFQFKNAIDREQPFSSRPHGIMASPHHETVFAPRPEFFIFCFSES